MAQERLNSFTTLFIKKDIIKDISIDILLKILHIKIFQDFYNYFVLLVINKRIMVLVIKNNIEINVIKM